MTTTATVVGPGTEEIYTEPAGRVKVQFHWDRDGRRDERSSCWLRAMQAWGGEGWGAQFIPRVGMEVVVTFEGGDPDRPLVLGCVYNGTHPPPFSLPADQTRSGFRTHSSPNAEGFNELSFQDRAGEEQIFIHAQRDLDQRVGRDHTKTIDRNRIEVVAGNASSRVVGTRTTETVGGASTTVGAGSVAAIRAEERIVLGCGDSSIEITSDAIRLRSPTITLTADKEIRAEGDGPVLRLDKRVEIHGEAVRLYSKSASVELDEHAHVDGRAVKLACSLDDPDDQTKENGEPATKPLQLRLMNARYEPYANKEFILKAGGARVDGRTDGDGNLVARVPLAADTAEITLWVGSRPNGDVRRYVVELKDVDAEGSLRGVQGRLRHLGYYHRAPSGELDLPTQRAIDEFQRDQGLPRNGQLDEGTRAAIARVHGA